MSYIDIYKFPDCLNCQLLTQSTLVIKCISSFLAPFQLYKICCMYFELTFVTSIHIENCYVFVSVLCQYFWVSICSLKSDCLKSLHQPQLSYFFVFSWVLLSINYILKEVVTYSMLRFWQKINAKTQLLRLIKELFISEILFHNELLEIKLHNIVIDI